MNDCLVVGCGYLGRRVAQRWQRDGRRVFAVTRYEQSAERFNEIGWHPIVADVTEAKSLDQLPAARTVLYSVGYDRSAAASIDEVYTGGVANVLAALRDTVRCFIYISTTGVYGDASGEWVDETTPPDPQRPGGKASLAAEQLLDDAPISAKKVVLRLAGIYGPDRIPFIDELKRGESIPAPQNGWLNLIHVDDAGAMVQRAEQFALSDAAAACTTINVADGHPVQRCDYYQEVARLIGADPPTFNSPDPRSPRAQRASTDRRISNRRMVELLQVAPAFPSYRDGLRSILAGN